jgi:hypothetical protein
MAESISREEQKDIENAIAQWVEWAKSLNMTVTDEEIDAQRAKLTKEITGKELIPLDASERELTSWEEVESALADPDTLVLDDYRLLEDKRALIGVPFFINNWRFQPSDTGGYVIVRCVARLPENPQGQKIVFTDGSTGIYAQLEKITKTTGKQSRMMVRHGLNMSEYDKELDDGTHTRAKTFYLT